MSIESFIEDPQSGKQAVYRRYNMPGSGHIYTSYPEGPGKFIAYIVGSKGTDSADVYEIPDGSTLELGFDPSRLPDGAIKTEVTSETPFEKSITAPNGQAGTLIVRCVGTTALS
jgi:hypothetical protein